MGMSDEARVLREINKSLRLIVAELVEMNGRTEQQLLARFGGPAFSLGREEEDEGEIIAEDSTLEWEDIPENCPKGGKR